MKKTMYLTLMILLLNTTLVASTPKQDNLVKKSLTKAKPKKYISKWRKAQWKKARLAKAKKKLLNKATKPKKYISEWRKAQWKKARLAKAKKKLLNKATKPKKKHLSKWRKAQQKKARLAKQKKRLQINSKLKKHISKLRKSKQKKAHFAKLKKKKWSKKSKKLTKYQIEKLNKIYKKVAKKTNINKRALKKAFSYYKKNKSKKALSSKYLAIADYTKTAKSKRLFIINLQNASVYKHQVAHGKYSGNIGGRVKHSSNRRNSKMTPYGFFKVGKRVGRTKKKGYKYLTVKGLSKSNRKVGYPSRAGGRDVVIHAAKYVRAGGRSHGCFAICPRERNRIFSKLKSALLYSYTGR